MNQILELREKRAKAWDAAKAFLDSKRGADGMLSAEDAATYDKMEADVVELGREVERLERQAAIDRELNQPVGKPITERPAAVADRARPDAPPTNTRPPSGAPCAPSRCRTRCSTPCRWAWNRRAAISRRTNTSARSSRRWRNRTSSASLPM